ncbi:MAG: AAA family ATPase [Lachnospiraceae bacterium]
MKRFVVTIARGFGSGGKYIGEKLGERLGIPCYEKEILTMASEKSGISMEIFAQSDEKLKRSLLVKELTEIPRSKVLSPQDKAFTSDNNLFAIQTEIIQTLADTQSCIIVGKCADYILRNSNNVLSVYIDAPRRACLNSIMSKMSVSEKEANKLIEKTDKYRADYYKYYTGGRDWLNPTNYHLFLNSDKFGRDACVDILESIIEYKFAD